MVVTRSMVQRKVPVKKSTIQTKKKNQKQQKITLRECVIRLDRLTESEIANLTGKPIVKLCRYDLRQRGKPAPEKPPKLLKKPSTAIAKTTPQLVSVLWNDLKKVPVIPPVNSVILAKMKSYSPWPSKLVAMQGEKCFVYFFGTNQHGHVTATEIALFQNGHILIRKLCCMRIPCFKKAVREAEVFLGIPSEQSILN